MRSPVLLGAVAALVVGALAMGGLLGAITSQRAQTPQPATPSPGSSPRGLYTPSPSPFAPPSPTPDGSSEPSMATGTQVGERAPRLVLPFLTGGQLDTANAAGTPLWINFMATWCPACRDELPMIQGAQVQQGDELGVILVDVAENEDLVYDFMIDLGVDLPVGLDLDSQAQAEWGAFALPMHFFIDAEGIVQEVVYGGAPREIFSGALAKIVPEASIAPEQTEEP